MYIHGRRFAAYFSDRGCVRIFSSAKSNTLEKDKILETDKYDGQECGAAVFRKGNTGTAQNTSRRCFFQGEATFSIAGNRFNHLTLHLFRCCDYASWEGDCLRDSLIRKFQFYFAFIALRAARSHWSVISGAKLRFPWMPRLFRGA